MDLAGWVEASVAHIRASAAPVAAVREALRDVVRQALGEIARSGNGDLALWLRLIRLVDEETARYAAARPSRTGVAAIARNATASAGQYPWAAYAGKPQQVLLCATCAAPQERVREFICSFCGGHLLACDGGTT